MPQIQPPQPLPPQPQPQPPLVPSQPLVIMDNTANLETLEYLLKLKQQENIPVTEIVDSDGNTLLHKAIAYAQHDIVRYLIKSHPNLLACANSKGLLPVHMAVMLTTSTSFVHDSSSSSSQMMQILRLVARESRKWINRRDTQGWTACMYAASEGKYEALKYLVDNVGAKVSKCTKRDRMNLLHLGVQSGELDVVQYLLIRLGTSYLKVKSNTNHYFHIFDLINII